MKRIYWKFWVWTPIIGALIFAFGESLDVQLHGTYMVLPTLHTALFLALFLFLSGLGYYLSDLSTKHPQLSLWHLRLTLLGLGLLILFFNLSPNGNSPITFLLLLSLLMISLGLILYFSNIIHSGIQSLKK